MSTLMGCCWHERALLYPQRVREGRVSERLRKAPPVRAPLGFPCPGGLALTQQAPGPLSQVTLTNLQDAPG